MVIVCTCFGSDAPTSPKGPPPLVFPDSDAGVDLVLGWKSNVFRIILIFLLFYTCLSCVETGEERMTYVRMCVASRKGRSRSTISNAGGKPSWKT